MAKSKKRKTTTKDNRPITLISYERYLKYSTELQESDFEWQPQPTEISEFHDNLCMLSDHWQISQRFADTAFQSENGMPEEPVIVAVRRWPTPYELYQATTWAETFYNIEEIIERIGVCQTKIRGLYCGMTAMMTFHTSENPSIEKTQLLCKETLVGKDDELSLYNSIMALIYSRYWTPGTPEWHQEPQVIGKDADGRSYYRICYQKLQYRYMRESYRRVRRGKN